VITFVESQVSVAGWYFPPVVDHEEIIVLSAPYDHFAASPDCGVAISRIGRARGRCPCVIGASAAQYGRKCIVAAEELLLQ